MVKMLTATKVSADLKEVVGCINTKEQGVNGAAAITDNFKDVTEEAVATGNLKKL